MNDPAPITTDFTEDLRYRYDLKPDSLVLDCGGYEGNFARLIYERYKCWVVVFEPVEAFYKQCQSIWKSVQGAGVKVEIYRNGVGAWDREIDLKIHGAMSRAEQLDPADLTERVNIIRLTDWIGEQKIDLLKLNIEGMEYEVIADLFNTCKIKQIKNLQVQFHIREPNDEKLHRVMRDELLRTHRLTYEFPFCWENYELRA